MVMGTNGLKLLTSYEKCPLTAYWDTVGKIWTIGWGHTKGVYQGMTETQLQADNVLKNDMLAYGKTVNNSIHASINQNQFDAMVDLCYNIGQSPINGFPNSSVVKDFNNGNIKAVPADFRKWDMAKGHFVQGLLNRRNAEINLFNTPDNAKKASTPAKTNNNTNAVDDAKKKANQVKANAVIKAKQKANDLAKANAINAKKALEKAKLTKNANAIKQAQINLNKVKVNPVNIKQDKQSQNITKTKVLKSGIGFLGIIATIVLLNKGYDL
jgi:lysozyme